MYVEAVICQFNLNVLKFSISRKRNFYFFNFVDRSPTLAMNARVLYFVLITFYSRSYIYILYIVYILYRIYCGLCYRLYKLRSSVEKSASVLL